MLPNCPRIALWQPPHDTTRKSQKLLNIQEATLKNLYTANDGHRTLRNVRYWGLEIEHPEAGNYCWQLGALVRESHRDETIPYVGENCHCDTCDHSCDCKQCQVRWRTCDHAGNTEVTLMPSLYSWHYELNSYWGDLVATGYEPSDFENWCSECQSENCESYDCDTGDRSNWGLHTHVDARDLTLQNVGSVMRLAGALFQRFEGAFGYDNYNHHASEADIREMLERGSVWGRNSVNPSGILRYFERHEADRSEAGRTPNADEKGTIEFRQFRWTKDPELMQARVATARAIVDYVKAGKPIFWLARETDLKQVLTELEIWKH
jgi:hypothetical protein